MALSNSEIQRAKYECGYNTLNAGAEPYISIVALWTNVIQRYINTDVATTSSTTITAASSPMPATLTLGTTTGLTVGDTLIIDVDARRERVTIQSISGSTVTVLLSKAHSGTYPVLLESGEGIVRDIIEKLEKVAAQIENAISTAGIKAVDEIAFFGNTGYGAKSQLDSLKAMRMYWRDELCSVLGVPNMWRYNQNSGGATELY